MPLFYTFVTWDIIQNMPPHVDSYSYNGSLFDGNAKWEGPSRLFEDGAALDYGKIRQLPYFNGYVLITPVHEDSECEQYRPQEISVSIQKVAEGEYRLPPLPLMPES